MEQEITKQITENGAEVVDAAAAVTDPSFLQSLALFMEEGGIFMYIIAFFWAVGIAFAIERYMAFTKFDSDGTSLMERIKKHILLNEVHKAIEICSGSKAALPRVMRSGLKRANQSRDQIQDAIGASILEVVPNMEKRMSYIALVANVSTLVGLLGTIYGLIQSFSSVASADASEKAKLLALGISKAMNTTAMGLISAISIMILHTLLTAKSEKIVSEVEENSVKLMDLLGTKKHVDSKAA